MTPVEYVMARQSELNRLLSEPLSNDQVEDLCETADRKYFLLNLNNVNRHPLDGNASKIIAHIERVAWEDRPKNDHVRLLGKNGSKFSLYAAVRLNEFVRSLALNGTDAAQVFADMGLRSGLPTGCLVPSLRLVNSERFRRNLYNECRISKMEFEKRLRALMPNSPVTKAVEALVGTSHVNGHSFTITSCLANKLTEILNSSTHTKARVVDDLFPVETGIREKQRIAALEYRAGNCY